MPQPINNKGLIVEIGDLRRNRFEIVNELEMLDLKIKSKEQFLFNIFTEEAMVLYSHIETQPKVTPRESESNPTKENNPIE